MRKLLSIFVVLLGFVLAAAPQRGDNGATGIAYENGSSSMPTAADYIQDGLIAMWDGIENVGYGIHDPNATTWVNLCGTGDFPISNSQLFWEDNALVRVGKGGGISCIPTIDLSDPLSPRTFEFVMDADGLPTNPANTYYFWALNNAGIRCTCDKVFGVQGFNVALRASAGMEPMVQNISSFAPLSVSMVGTDAADPRYTERNIALYYLNGSIKTQSLFGGNPTSSPKIELFRFARDWPDVMRIGMHCFRIYNRALSAEEVAYNHEIDRLRFSLGQ